MRLTTRRTLIGLSAAGIIGVPILLAIYLSLGLWFAPPWPVPATSHVMPLVGDALWARANGGAATELRPINPVSIAQLAVCIGLAETEDDAALQRARQAECLTQQLPAFAAVEYLSELHLRAANLEQPGFRKGHAKFVTTIWLTRSFTKAELLDTLAARGDFGMGFRGVEAAAQGYFGRATAQLGLPQVAMVAAFIGGEGPDPWCDPAAAASMRHRILERMRDHNAIDEQAFGAADRSELSLAGPPANHVPCEG